MKVFKYSIPVWSQEQTPIDLENPPEHWSVIEGQCEYEDLEDAFDSLVYSSPYIVDEGEVSIEEIA
jgi:hypothetical protein